MIYAITSPLSSSRGTLVEQVSRFLALGIGVIQIREKETPPERWMEDARHAVRLAHGAGAIVIMNDRADLALSCGCDGVHVGHEDPLPARLRACNPTWIIGLSCSNEEEAVEGLANPNVDYLGIGPIYATPIKSELVPTDLDLLRILTGRGKPLVAIGGITPQRVAEVIAAGAEMAAMIRGMWDL